MASPSSVHSRTMKAGTCPHGLPLGACPICNGMAGGNSTTKRNIPRNVGEMTYNQCAAIGAMLRAQKHAKEQAKIAQQNYIQSLTDFAKNIANTHQRLADLMVRVTQNLPPVVAKPMNFVLKVILTPVQTVLRGVVVILHKFADITDKLTAVYGELKAAIKEKVSKFAAAVKKKLKSIFFVFGADETDDEEKKIDEAKRTFELKTFIHKLAQKLKGKRKNEY